MLSVLSEWSRKASLGRDLWACLVKRKLSQDGQLNDAGLIADLSYLHRIMHFPIDINTE